MNEKPIFCLTFDLEEFDLPLEYKQPIELQQQVEISETGLQKILPILKSGHYTFFTTAVFAQCKSELVRELAQSHEIASHNFSHSQNASGDYQRSKKVLEEISGQKILGFRMPRMMSVNLQSLTAAGYLYDASAHPTFMPGRYNHLRAPKTIHNKENLIIVPATVTPIFRFPLFWLSFKNLPFDWYLKLVENCLKKYGYVVLYLHPWEFSNLSSHHLPRYIVGKKGKMENRLQKMIKYFDGKVRWETIKTLLQEKNELPRNP